MKNMMNMVIFRYRKLLNRKKNNSSINNEEVGK